MLLSIFFRYIIKLQFQWISVYTSRICILICTPSYSNQQHNYKSMLSLLLAKKIKRLIPMWPNTYNHMLFMRIVRKETARDCFLV